MKILFGKKWKDGFLDYHRSPAEYRIEVLAWATLEKLENVYHIRPKSLRLLMNYYPVVGPNGMFWKIWSRLREHYRNQKFVSCGVGRVLEGPSGGKFKTGDIVGFTAPLHPALVERICLPEELVSEVHQASLPAFPKDEILYTPVQSRAHRFWNDIRGWHMQSMQPIAPALRDALAEGVKKTVAETDWSAADRFPTGKEHAAAEIAGTPADGGRKKKAVLFGFGNYAKINILPYSRPFVHITTVHEIDPTQIFWERSVERWDTAPFPRTNEKYDAYFIATYNHTHVPIALNALDHGAYVVMEKPIASTHEQFTELMASLKRNGQKLFIGFQKRYSHFNDLAKKDLAVKPGDPISYHCIVHEIIQPEFFWYNWPVSGSRLFSNGCHHVDHFLFLNDFSEPAAIDLKVAKDGTIDVWIELKNGALFTMVFTEKGSSRVGPRDTIEMKTPGRNVKLTDATTYFSEHGQGIIRRKKVYKIESYRRMYQAISKKISRGEPGDSLHSIRVSAEVMLVLEDKLREALQQQQAQ
jgi:predicted dehydrogenase